MPDTSGALELERADLLAALGAQRRFLRQTLRGMTDDQAAMHPTASELCLGGIVKHVALVEASWVSFIREGPAAIGSMDAAAHEAHAAGFQMVEGDSVDSLLATYEDIASATDEVLRTVPSLDDSQPLPEAPWFEPGARRSVRGVLLHVIAETAQHAGHADIIRETIDGAKTMG